MGDFQRCWVKTTHEQHGWTEVDGKGVSVVDASTVLQGAKYHFCVGVPNLVEESKNMRRRETDPYGHDRLVTVQEQIVGGIRVIRERRITLDAIYERTVREDVEWVEVQRLTCFCCTCGDGYSSDVYCRNHGGHWGMRPCEVHGVEGSTIVDIDDLDTGKMPDSVQVERARQKAVDSGTQD